jgi:hypothetical protein
VSRPQAPGQDAGDLQRLRANSSPPKRRSKQQSSPAHLLESLLALALTTKLEDIASPTAPRKQRAQGLVDEMQKLLGEDA